ncbi:MAG: SPOR domain-containing protein [Cocleimonas sp.]
MDNSLVKRGIGVVVLVIIAVVLLSTLISDKSNERQDIVDMKLPGAPDINIPNLTEPTTSVEQGSAAILVSETSDNIAETSNTVIESATGALTAAKEKTTEVINSTMDNTAEVASTAKRGFSFRPANKNEEKNNINAASTTDQEPASTIQDNSTTVVASASEQTKKFKPRLVEEKKKVVKKASKPAKKEVAIKKAAKPVKKENKAKTTVAKTTKKPTKQAMTTGKYSVQLLATSSQSRANKLAKTMNGEGYKSFITRTERNNKTLYRVRVGSHTNRNSAIKAQEGMKRRYQKNFFVQNSLVVSN